MRREWIKGFCLIIFLNIPNEVVVADVVVKIHADNSADVQQIDIPFSEGLRLSQLSDRITPLIHCSYGAVLKRLSLVGVQDRTQRGLLYDLNQLKLEALKAQKTDLAQWASTLYRQVAAQPVTGRMTGINLNPIRSELDNKFNPALEDGDVIEYPSCTTGFGALNGRGLVYIPSKESARVSDIVDREVRLTWQAPGYLWQVQSDGEIYKRRIGYWSRSGGKYQGGYGFLFRPLKEKWNRKIHADFNYDLAQWLATQQAGVPFEVTP